LRCHPFAKAGLDYVPIRFSLRKNTIDREEPDYSMQRKQARE
jgi:putative component of membrane protein insertase Oxa1/YidC/SpoIIIJ protein YidD